ncbi:MAG: UDP-3-O-acyl-N-acetylglucosamine deacetylase [Pseudomonadota bacterium]
MRYTVQRAVVFRGVGLHGGQPATATVCPALAGHGIVFERTDVAPGTGVVPARYDLVNDTRLCTKLENAHGVSIGTVEHLMAALAGVGIADARITLDGPEVPIMDGSAREFVEGFRRVGLQARGTARRAIRVLETIEVVKDGKRAAFEPSDGFGVRFAIDFADPAIGRQAVSIALSGPAFVDGLADCRTFGHLAEVEHLRKLGLARGGSLDNAIVVDRGRVLNPQGLRRPDEFVRHKVLDVVGDLALAGAPIMATYVGEKAGHEMTNLLLRALFDRPDAWCWTELGARGRGLGPARRTAVAARRAAMAV